MAPCMSTVAPLAAARAQAMTLQLPGHTVNDPNACGLKLKLSSKGSVCCPQDFLIRLRIMKGLKQPFTILDSVSGVLRPVRPLLPTCASSCFTPYRDATSCGGISC